MPLTRPAYKVTAENVTAGWTYEATQGDDSTLTDDVQLADDLKMSWTFTNGETPGQLDPDQVTFRLFSLGGADTFPPIDVGDELIVTLERPLALGTTPYMTFRGRAAEPTATPHSKGLIAVLTGTGHLAGLNSITVGDSTWAEDTSATAARFGRIAELAKINLFPADVGTQDLGAMDVDARSAGELLVELGNGYGSPQPQILRASQGGLTPTFINNDSDLYYYFDEYEATDFGVGLAPYVLVADGLVATLDFQAIDPGDVRQLSADHVDMSVGWRKDKSDAINQVALTGIAPLSNPSANVTVIAEHPDLIKKYGVNSRTIVSQVRDPRAYFLDLAAPYLPAHDDAIPNWSVDSITIYTETMTDAELDRYASVFFPHTPDVAPTVLPRRLIIPDVDGQWEINGVAITGILTGCSFEISKGELVIKPTIRNQSIDPDTFADGVTWADLAADAALDDTVWESVTDLHIDPDLTWADLALATI